jgi:[ribosomal protein S5]-alanine N-acetyltransferase
MILRGTHSLLRPWQVDDAPALAAAANDIRIWRTVRDRFPHPYTLDAANQYIALHSPPADITQLAITVNHTVVGGIGWIPGTDIHRITAELGYWLGVDFWGRGIATDAVRTLTPALFAAHPILHRLFAVVSDNNPASVRVLEQGGFTREGTLRQNAIKDGVVGDSILYARVRTDPAPP